MVRQAVRMIAMELIGPPRTRDRRGTVDKIGGSRNIQDMM